MPLEITSKGIHTHTKPHTCVYIHMYLGSYGFANCIYVVKPLGFLKNVIKRLAPKMRRHCSCGTTVMEMVLERLYVEFVPAYPPEVSPVLITSPTAY